MSNRIILNTVSYHGKGAIKEIPAIAKTKGFAHVFVCSDPDLIQFGVTAKVTDLLDEAGRRICDVCGIPGYNRKI